VISNKVEKSESRKKFVSPHSFSKLPYILSFLLSKKCYNYSIAPNDTSFPPKVLKLRENSGIEKTPSANDNLDSDPSTAPQANLKDTSLPPKVRKPWQSSGMETGAPSADDSRDVN
jgi:hypothetical protein